MIQIAVSFLLGALIFQTVPILPPWQILLLVPVVIALSKYFPRGRLLYIVFAGFIWSYLHAISHLWPSLDHRLEGQDIEITGTVEEVRTNSQHYTRFIFQTDKVGVHEYTPKLPNKMMISWYYPKSDLNPGQTCQLIVRLKRYWRFANPGSSDIEKTMFLQGIGARGYVREGACQNVPLSSSQSIGLRDQLIQRFKNQKHTLDYFAWMMALSYGVRDDLNDQDWQVLRRSGTAHLVAISGLHLSVIGIFVFFVCRHAARCSVRLCERFGAQRVAACCAMLAVIFYAYLAGFSIPTQRALIMVCIAFTAIIFNKPVVSFPLVATTLFIILLWDPLSVITASFWLSFLAVLSIFFIIKSAPSTNKWRLALRIQVFLAVALFPISLWFFQEGSVISPFVNLMAVPYISFIVLPLLLLTQMLFALGLSIANELFDVLDNLLALFWWMINQATTYSLSSYRYQPSLMGVLLFEFGGMLFLFGRQRLFRLIALVLCAGLFLVKPNSLDDGQLRLAVLDVGQGLALVIETQKHALLYDVGPRFPSGFSTAEAVVIPYLRSRHIHHLDKMVISHHDNDHAGGLQALLNSDLVGELMVGHVAKTKTSFPAQKCRQGDQWLWGEVTFNVLHPPANWQSNNNNSSCVIQILHPAGTILLTGDIEAEVEYRLLAQFGDNLRSDIIVVPHHGSLSSSSEEFLQAVDPRIAIFSTGYRNRYGFPHATIQSRYQALGIRQLNTADKGAIVFELGVDSGIKEQAAYRITSQRYWHSDIIN